MPNADTSIADYSGEFTRKVETALLDIWGRLGEYRDHLVLVGGLAPRYIVAPRGTRDYDAASSHCGTMDIDFGISLAVADTEQYKQIYTILTEAGFANARNERGNRQHHSFVKGTAENAVVIDFLTPTYHGPANSLMHRVDGEISAIQTKGLGLALKSPLKCTISGTNSAGDQVEEIVNVCRPVAYIILKALAFDGRRKDKDVYDMMFVLEHYQNGVDSVIGEITGEDRDAASFADALSALERHFKGIGYSGPRAYERFCGEVNSAPRAYAAVRRFLELCG